MSETVSKLVYDVLAAEVPGFSGLSDEIRDAMCHVWEDAVTVALSEVGFTANSERHAVETIIRTAFPIQLRPSRRVSAEEERDFGRVKVRLSAELWTRPTRAAVDAAYDEVWEELEHQFQRYGENRLQVAAGQRIEENGGMETVDAEAITCETKQGKKYYRIRAGRWTKYGVTVWPEVLEGAGIDLRALDVNGEDYELPHGSKATIALKDGKPVKVTKLNVV